MTEDNKSTPGKPSEAKPAATGASATAPPKSSLGRAMLDAIITGNSAVVTFLAILLALVVGGVLMILADQDVLDQYKYFTAAPGDALSASWSLVSDAYSAMFKGSIMNPDLFADGSIEDNFRPISETITQATPLIFGGLAVSIAFRTGLFNIGAQGQIIAGAVFASWIGFVVDLPPVIHLVFVILAGVIGGGLYAGIAGFLKARFGAHEVIVTIMLNHVAVLLLGWLLTTDTFRRGGQSQPIGKDAHDNAVLPNLFGDNLRIHFGIILALLAAGIYWWLLNRSTLGFELRAVGSNPDAARTAGMSVARAQILAMVIAGAMAGLAGVSQVMSSTNPAHTLTPAIDAGIGFDAITVALLGRTKPLGTVLAALLFGALRAGGSVMQASANVSVDIVIVIQAVIVLFVAAPPLVRSIFRLRGARKGAEGGPLAAKETVGVQA
ncbi:ABC transporter permease [Embleya scabrispora]|uniref:ABC transporter permease n=1 Tax=Embleya scabrispora TaxID=159449 RepID=A0A1T3NX30_9ACTN|nr:ABC transporter permease [Embleya scabrispora]OPC81315.1 ABC transporter permease [Embleya scabrispora]